MESKCTEEKWSTTPLLHPVIKHATVCTNLDPAAKLPVDSTLDDKPHPKIAFYAWKDVLVLASGTFCYNFGYIAFIFNLSTLYDDANLTFTTLSVNCAAQLVASLFLPALLVRRWGCKTTAIISVSSVLVFSAAQFYPTFATFIPASGIVGFGNACLWVAVSTYISHVGLDLAAAQKQRPDVVLSRFFAAANFVRFSGAVAGNLLLFILLNARKNSASDSSSRVRLSQCGAAYCSENMPTWTSTANQSLEHIHGSPMPDERTTVFGVFLGVGLLGPVLLWLALNPRRNLQKPWDPSAVDVPNSLLATAHAMKGPKHLLLMTTFLTAGLVRSFLSGDFPKGFVLCAIGLNDVSLSATINQLCYIGGTTSITFLVQGFGIAGAFTVAHTLCILTLAGLLLWTPFVPLASTLLFVASGILGAVIGAYNNLNNTIIGILFPENKEESYGVYRFHYALGAMIGYAWSVGVCMNVKIGVLMGVVTTAEGTFLLLEYSLRKKHTFDDS